jgi:protein-disulfide isomerase
VGKGARNRSVRAGAVAPRGAAKPSTTTLVALVAVTAAALAGALVLGSVLTTRDEGTAAPAPGAVPALAGAVETGALLAGIPQRGIALGRPDAPVTLVEFADFQCPYCAAWSRDALSELVRDYVRPGKVRIVFRGLAFLGPDSHEALRFALAAGRQGKLWNVAHLLYESQGKENAGWVTDDLLGAVGRAVPGLEVERALTERSRPEIDAGIAAGEAAATEHGVRGTPSFAVGRTGAALRPVALESLDAHALRPVLESLLEG